MPPNGTVDIGTAPVASRQPVIRDTSPPLRRIVGIVGGFNALSVPDIVGPICRFFATSATRCTPAGTLDRLSP